MASVGESVSTNKRKGDGQRELQEEEGKSKKKMYSCKYKQDYPFIYRSHKEDKYAKCNSCRIDIIVARGGKNDVTKHVTSKNHKQGIAAEKRNQE